MNLELRLGEFVQPIGLISKVENTTQEELPELVNALQLKENLDVNVSEINTYLYEQLDALGPNLEGSVVDVVLSKSLTGRGYTLTFNDPNAFKNSFLGELDVEFIGDIGSILFEPTEKDLKPFFSEFFNELSKHLTFDVYSVFALNRDDLTTLRVNH